MTDDPDVRSYDIIVCSVSGGKDSACVLHRTVEICGAAGVLDRVRVVHCDLGEEDWPKVPELAARHAARYGLPLTVVRREDDTLLAYATRRGAFPSSAQRWCTSEFKRGPSRRALTEWTRQAREGGITGRPVRILDIMGFRAQESPARAKRLPFARDEAASNGRRDVDRWLPIHTFTLADVRRVHEQHQLELHQAYRLGMRRLSCSFCVLAGRDALVRAAKLRPDLAAAYQEVEHVTGHAFKHGLPMSRIIALSREPATPPPATLFTDDSCDPAHWKCPTWPPMNEPITVAVAGAQRGDVT